MAKQAETARNTISEQCETGEHVRSVGLFWSGGIWALFLMWLMKEYWIGVTDKRLIIIRLNALSQPVINEMLSVPLSNVTLVNNKILVNLPGNEKPQLFEMRFGYKGATGFDVTEFKASLTS